MQYLLTLAIYVLAFGTVSAALNLSLTLWLFHRQLNFFKTFLFIVYLTVLFFFSGLRFALTSFAGWTEGTLIFDMLEIMALASLIYFLPATMNFLLGRKWTRARITRVIISSVIYLSSGIVGLFINSSVLPGLSTILSFLFILIFVLVDAARELPLIQDDDTRTVLFLMYSVTFLYLPISHVVRFMLDGFELLLFVSLSIYHLLMGICALFYFHRSLLLAGTGMGHNTNTLYSEACSKAGLTAREIEIALLISSGFTYKEIAAKLDISPHTVSHHVVAIYRKTGTRSKVEMVNALRNPQQLPQIRKEGF